MWCGCCFLFFKQKTAYEMRISDWSSDVCSSDLVPFVRLGRDDNAIAQLRGAGFGLAATVVRGGEDVFAARLPQRLVYVLGAEGEGMDAALADACDLRLSIPGRDRKSTRLNSSH